MEGPIGRLGNVILPVENLGKAVEFYQRTLGLPLKFRDGDRWLLHYMKWTPDGHVIPALASSRDGLNYTRVCGGTPTLPLGEPGTWEAGRVAFRNPPYLVDGVWRHSRYSRCTTCGRLHDTRTCAATSRSASGT